MFTSLYTLLALSVSMAAHVQSLYKPKIIGRLTFNNDSKQGTAGLVVSIKHETAEKCDLKQLLMHIYQTQSMGGLLQTRCVAVYYIDNTGNNFISLQLTTSKVRNKCKTYHRRQYITFKFPNFYTVKQTLTSVKHNLHVTGITPSCMHMFWFQQATTRLRIRKQTDKMSQMQLMPFKVEISVL